MPNRTIDLNGKWQLAGFDGYGQSILDEELTAALPNLLWLDAEVPGSVYLDLMRAEWLPDLYAGCNTLAARWVEDDYWFYRRTFVTPELAPGERLYLVAEGLDLDTVVYLNRRVLAAHHNMFRPLRIDITDLVRRPSRASRNVKPAAAPLENDLVLRLNSGRLRAADKRGGDYNLELCATATKRMHLRKPQFCARWDWSPRLLNVGICGGVRLEICRTARLDEVAVTPELSSDHIAATLHVRAHCENITALAQDLMLRCRLTQAQAPIAKSSASAHLLPGAGEIRCALHVDQPRLWQPRGHGEQHLYELEVELFAGTERIDARRLTTGIRSVEIQQPPAPDKGRLFHMIVNGEPIFCKGANWVPADLLYPRVRPADYEQLVALAVECGCNTLRIWGGGLYADPALLAACDRAGLLVWHDFIFACSKYPGDDPDFVVEVEAEVRHQLRRLSPHPSLAVWCGNNEIDVGVADHWIVSYDRSTRPCHDLFHRRLAAIIAEEDASRPYWPSSPWSPDGGHPADPSVGDQHPWLVALGPPKGDYWLYRDDASRFPNEGGMLGPSTPATLRQILPSDERRVGSRTWLHHDNTQNNWRGEPLLDHLLRVNLIEHPRSLAFDDYIRYGGILHGEALETAIDNWRRRKWQSAAAVFWMFNDTWPATVSWTPIDYYRRRKPAFWYVKRAFAELRPICVEVGDEVAFFVVNDALEARSVTLRYGLFALAGGRPVDQTVSMETPANAALIAARLPLADWDRLGIQSHAAFAVLHAGGERSGPPEEVVAQHRLFRARFKDLAWTRADVRVAREPGGLRLSCDTFAWAVCLDDSGEQALSSNYFDLIPGIDCIVPWPTDRPTPTPIPANPQQKAVPQA